MARREIPVHLRPDGTIGAGTHSTLPSELLELVRRPAWMADALCREYPAVSWFPERGETVDAAKAVCARCLVQDECRAFADGDCNASRYGIWGGLSARQRRREGQRENQSAAA